MKKTNLKKGFTLIEILIASYIFVLVIIAGEAIFSSSIGSKMKATSFMETQQDSRTVMEKISQLIRDPKTLCIKADSMDSSYLDIYDAYDVNTGCSQQVYHIYLSNSNINLKQFNSDGSLKSDTQINSGNTNITNTDIFNGYYPSPSSTHQPFVTIKLTTKNIVGNRKIDADTLTLQTTIDFRNYGYKYEN
jgi:type II secretory pathway pseudopilin PulG